MLNSLRQKNLHKGPNSSQEFNKQVENTRKDIELLYNYLNKNEEDIYESTNITLNENFFLQRRVQALENEVNKLKHLIESDEEKILVYSNFYNSSNISLEIEDAVSVDKVYGIAAPNPTNITNKLSHLTDSGRTVIPHDLEVIIEEENSKDFRSVELSKKMNDVGLQEDDIFSQTNQVPREDFHKIVDKKRDSYWTRTIVANENLEIFGRVFIKVPREGVTNLFSNTLNIAPYPEGSMTIHSIMVKGLGNQWDLLDNYPTEGDSPLPIKNAGKLSFHFPRKEITEIIINFSQPYFLENNQERIFTYGFQGIDLEYRLYTKKENSFVTEIDISHTGEFFNEIERPTVVEAPGTNKNIEDLVDHKLYYDKSLNTEFSFNTSILTPINKVYIKTTLKRDGERVPVLQEIRNSYTIKKD